MAKSDNYIPFGPEWKKELMKHSKQSLEELFGITAGHMTKKQLIDLIKQKLEHELEKRRKAKLMENFDMENQYALFLQRLQLDEEKLHPVERIERKKTFMLAWGQLLLLMRDDISQFEEDEAIDILNGMVHQVNEFLEKEIERFNRQNN